MTRSHSAFLVEPWSEDMEIEVKSRLELVKGHTFQIWFPDEGCVDHSVVVALIRNAPFYLASAMAEIERLRGLVAASTQPRLLVAEEPPFGGWEIEED